MIARRPSSARSTTERPRRRGQNRRLRRLLFGLAALLVVALLTGTIAVLARSQAQKATITADAKRLAANALNVQEPDLALLSALEAVNEEKSPETYGALLTLLSREPAVITRVRTPERFLVIQVSPDGRTVYLGENAGGLWAVDAETGAARWHVKGPVEQMVSTMSLSADGSTLLVTYTSADSNLVAVDTTTGSVSWTLGPSDLSQAVGPGGDGYVGAARWYSPDRFAVATSTDMCLLQGRTTHVERCLP